MHNKPTMNRVCCVVPWKCPQKSSKFPDLSVHACSLPPPSKKMPPNKTLGLPSDVAPHHAAVACATRTPYSPMRSFTQSGSPIALVLSTRGASHVSAHPQRRSALPVSSDLPGIHRVRGASNHEEKWKKMGSRMIVRPHNAPHPQKRSASAFAQRIAVSGSQKASPHTRRHAGDTCVTTSRGPPAHSDPNCRAATSAPDTPSAALHGTRSFLRVKME